MGNPINLGAGEAFIDGVSIGQVQDVQYTPQPLEGEASSKFDPEAYRKLIKIQGSVTLDIPMRHVTLKLGRRDPRTGFSDVWIDGQYMGVCPKPKEKSPDDWKLTIYKAVPPAAPPIPDKLSKRLVRRNLRGPNAAKGLLDTYGRTFK